MSKYKKITLISNCIISLVLIVVFAFLFIPVSAEPMYGGEEYGAIYNGNRQNKKVSLMFNVYENSEVVNEIIKVLDKYGAKATFFVGGCWADDNADTLKNIVNSGNEIANHGYFHKDHAKLSYEKNKEEILNTNNIILSLCGVKANLFAPPSGSFSAETLKASFDLGHKVIMWSKDTIDWRDKDQNKVFYRATNNLSMGDLILMHPKSHTLLALPSILEYYNSIGYKAVTVTENLAN